MISAVASSAFVALTEEPTTPGLVGTLGVQIRDALDNVVEARTTAGIVEVVAGSGIYRFAGTAPALPGAYVLVWDTGGVTPIYSSELMQVQPGSGYTPVGDITTVADLSDLAVLVPWARRACEGPFGPPAGLGTLLDSQLYPMVADACAEIILFSGSLFGHTLVVAGRDPVAGYPIQWKTSEVLDQWEAAIVICQVALDYYFHVFRDMKTSETITNEGTEWSYTLSANVIRSYVQSLQDQRDLALAGLKKHHPVIDRYASNIRVRDQATVAMLEWWDNKSPGVGGAGIPGGQEAAVIPWTPGWSGGWSP